MGDYGRTGGTGSVGTAAVRNDDGCTLDLPEQDDLEELKLKNHIDTGDTC